MLRRKNYSHYDHANFKFSINLFRAGEPYGKFASGSNGLFI